METARQNSPKSLADKLANLFLKFFAFNFNNRPSLNKYLKGDDGWLNFSFGIRTDNRSVEQAICFETARSRC